MEKTPQTYVSGANLNQFECGFQQRLWDKPGEKLYYNPVFERADKHDDRADKFLCLANGKDFEYESVGKSTCYGDEKGAWGFMCQEKCGFRRGIETEWEFSPNPEWYMADGEYPLKSRPLRGRLETLESVRQESMRSAARRGSSPTLVIL